MLLKLTKSGGRQYGQLVESFRNDVGHPRQRIGTHGRLEPGGDFDKLIGALQRARPGGELRQQSSGGPAVRG